MCKVIWMTVLALMIRVRALARLTHTPSGGTYSPGSKSYGHGAAIGAALLLERVQPHCTARAIITGECWAA